MALEAVNRRRGYPSPRRGARLDLQALGHRRDRRPGGGDRRRWGLLRPRPLLAVGRLYGVGRAPGDGPGTRDARLRGGRGPGSVLFLVRVVHGHRVRASGRRTHRGGRRAARLPARGERHLHRGGGVARGRVLAPGGRVAAGWRPGRRAGHGRPGTSREFGEHTSLLGPRRRPFPALGLPRSYDLEAYLFSGTNYRREECQPTAPRMVPTSSCSGWRLSGPSRRGYRAPRP